MEDVSEGSCIYISIQKLMDLFLFSEVVDHTVAEFIKHYKASTYA
jgi:hypothetical protein